MVLIYQTTRRHTIEGHLHIHSLLTYILEDGSSNKGIWGMITVGWIKIRDNTYVTLYVLNFNLNGWASLHRWNVRRYSAGEIGKSHKDIQSVLFCRAAETGKELVLLSLVLLSYLHSFFHFTYIS